METLIKQRTKVNKNNKEKTKKIKKENEPKKDKRSRNKVRYMARWTEEEDEFLKEHYGTSSFHAISKKLNRSVHAIEKRSERLGLGATREYAGYVTAFHLSKLLNVDSHTVLNWIENHKLPHFKKVTRMERPALLIEPRRFWDWARKNKDIILFHRIPKNALLPEPWWVDKSREESRTKYSARHQCFWTRDEDRELLKLTQKGLTQQEIGDKLGRSRSAVQRRLSRIRDD